MWLQRTPMPLQRFAAPDTGLEAGGASAPTPAPAAAPAPAPEPPPTLDFGGRQIPVADPAIRDLHGDWQSQQRELTRLREENQRTQAVLQALAGGQAPGQPPGQAAGLTEQDVEAFMSEFYERGPAAIQNLVERYVNERVMPRVEPFVQQQEFAGELTALRAQFPDVDAMMPLMGQVFDQYPNIAEQPRAMETAYRIARGMAPAPQSAKSPDELLNDPEFQTKILNHPEIRNRLLGQYLSGKQSQAAGLPPSTAGLPGGTPPAAPANAPRTPGEAVKAWMTTMGMRG